jgi:hypothetical protein
MLLMLAADIMLKINQNERNMKSASRNLILIAIVVISTLMHLEHFPKDLMS